MYTQSKNIIVQRYFFTRSAIIYASHIKYVNPIDIKIDYDRLGKLIKNNYVNEVLYLMEIYFFTVIEAKDNALFADLIRYFVSELYTYHEKAIDFHTGLVFKLYDETTDTTWYDANSIYQWLKHKFLELFKTFSNASYQKYSDVVNEAIEYVNKNYVNSELSAELIADNLNIQPSRLNIKFKSETGETFWKFIIKVRMEKAKDLLISTNKKVSEICQLTGYISYFSKVFKEIYGTTPLEYRRKNSVYLVSS